MTVEEALVALLAAVAGILLFLGLAQAHSGALGINKYVTIVGYSQTAGGNIHAVLWRGQ